MFSKVDDWDSQPRTGASCGATTSENTFSFTGYFEPQFFTVFVTVRNALDEPRSTCTAPSRAAPPPNEVLERSSNRTGGAPQATEPFGQTALWKTGLSNSSVSEVVAASSGRSRPALTVPKRASRGRLRICGHTSDRCRSNSGDWNLSFSLAWATL
jgi:hypothetical protein